MKIILLTKVIHPTISPRVFRVMELAKELGRRDYEVYIYANLGEYDYSFFESLDNIKIRDIGRLNFAVQNSDKILKRNYLNRALKKFFGYWIEFPDIEFLWKTSNVIKKEIDADLIISFAVPHAIHWGVALSRSRSPIRFPTVWIADCGDPFIGNPFKNPPSYFSFFERLMCRKADYITIPVEEARSAYDVFCQDKIYVIPQGFKFELPDPDLNPENSVPTFLYAGNFYPPARDPRPFLDFLSTLKDDFLFIVHTQHINLLKPYRRLLGSKLVVQDFIPRQEIISKMKKMDFLVNFNNGTEIQSPSKLIDYAITGRPVLSVDSHKVPIAVLKSFLSGDYNHKMHIPNLDQYRIENVADQFLGLYHKKIENNI